MNPRRPNLVYLFADQLRYQSLGYAGDARARTPHIDRLASESTSFAQCVSGSPVCAAYRASLWTGKYTTSTGMVINELRLNPDHHPNAFGRVLTRNGYQTSYIGKWHLWANQLGNHEDPRNSFTPPGPDRLGFDGFWASYGFHHAYYNDPDGEKGHTVYYHTDSPEKIPVEGYEPDAQTDLAIEQLERAKASSAPFALVVSYGTPHDPWDEGNVPPEYLARLQDVEFTLPPNYRPDNDPYGDWWAHFHGDDRDRLLDWMRVYYAMTARARCPKRRCCRARARRRSSQTASSGEACARRGTPMP